MKNLFITILISLLIVGCQTNSTKQKETTVETNEKKKDKTEMKTLIAEPKEYKIDISALKIGERSLKIVITTNFPDDANLFLGIGRIHYLKGKNEKYSGDIFNSDFTVEKGKIETTVEIDDSEWYNEHQRLVKELPNDIMPISKISDDIKITVIFSPARTQPKRIINLVGEYGEFIKGEGVDKLGKLTTFKASKNIYLPFKK